MRSIVIHKAKDLRIEETEVQTPNAGEVLVRIATGGICGSDLHMYHGDHIGSADYGAGVEKFCVGHEFIGEVVEVGSHSHGHKVGDKVLAAGGTGCGTCDLCRTGRAGQCPAATAFGLSHALNGGQAEYADQCLMKIPEGVSDEHAILLTDAMATASFGIGNSGVEAGQSIAIVGLGPIGLIGIELALLRGASQVFAIDPVSERRAHAAKLGANALEPGAEAMGKIKDATRGGVDCVFEASGAKAAVDSVLPMVRAGGTVSFIGLPQPEVALPLALVLYKNITVKAGIAPVPQLWPGLVPLIRQGRLKAEGLFSHNMSMSDGAEAYRMFDAREDGVVKILMDVA